MSEIPARIGVTELLESRDEWQERAERAERELKILREVYARGCDCSPEDACRFARERDDEREKVEALVWFYLGNDEGETLDNILSAHRRRKDGRDE